MSLGSRRYLLSPSFSVFARKLAQAQRRFPSFKHQHTQRSSRTEQNRAAGSFHKRFSFQAQTPNYGQLENQKHSNKQTGTMAWRSSGNTNGEMVSSLKRKYETKGTRISLFFFRRGCHHPSTSGGDTWNANCHAGVNTARPLLHALPPLLVSGLLVREVSYQGLVGSSIEQLLSRAPRQGVRFRLRLFPIWRWFYPC